MIEATLSRAVSRRTGAAPHVCWLNCWRALTLDFEKVPFLAGAVYVEGLISLREFPVWQEHAWLELGGVIIEPTLCLFDWWTPDAHFYRATARASRLELLERGTPEDFPLLG